jgi:hypothetical protein
MCIMYTGVHFVCLASDILHRFWYNLCELCPAVARFSNIHSRQNISHDFALLLGLNELYTLQCLIHSPVDCPHPPFFFCIETITPIETFQFYLCPRWIWTLLATHGTAIQRLGLFPHCCSFYQTVAAMTGHHCFICYSVSLPADVIAYDV